MKWGKLLQGRGGKKINARQGQSSFRAEQLQVEASGPREEMISSIFSSTVLQSNVQSCCRRWVDEIFQRFLK